MNRSSAGIEHSGDRHFLPCKLLWRFLIAQRVGIGSVVQHKQRAMGINAGDGALGIGRSHSHLSVVARGAHTVRDRACERALRLCRPERRDDEENDEGFHVGSAVTRNTLNLIVEPPLSVPVEQARPA